MFGIGLECSWVPWGFLGSWGDFWAVAIQNFSARIFRPSTSKKPRLSFVTYTRGHVSIGRAAAQRLKPGTVVISNTFRMPGWEPEKVVQLNDLHRTSIYRYIVA